MGLRPGSGTHVAALPMMRSVTAVLSGNNPNDADYVRLPYETVRAASPARLSRSALEC